MPELKGISFSDEAYLIVEKLIARLQTTGACEPYGLCKMYGGRGELRFAHQEPQNHKKARGVFAGIISTHAGAHLIRSQKTRVTGPRSLLLSHSNLEQSAREIEQHRQFKKPREKRNEKVDPNKPGTVQGGQIESNRREH